jgi:glycosyltransferase involved in cell wall biosynthesis
MKIALFGTHPQQFNGYSKVIYELTKELAIYPDVELVIFGFQKFSAVNGHRQELPDSVVIHDAAAAEEPKGQGFGMNSVREFIKTHKPDICMVYNDILVITATLQQLNLSKQEDGMTFKVIAYIDQVYLNQKKEYIKFVNESADMALMFTKYWEKTIVSQGLSIPTGFLLHGFNKDVYFPVKQSLARKYYGIKEEDFIVLNLNRNQPRKRWDTCLKAFAEIVSKYPSEPIKLLIGTAIQGAWNLLEVFEIELKKRNLTLEDGLKHLVILDRPQAMNDDETNILYNVADVGINTCDGEGFGLCNFEQAAIGIPQIVPRLGGFVDFFDDNNAVLIDPKLSVYIDTSRDAVGGEALLTDYIDFADAIEMYYKDRKLLKRHGDNARQKIIVEYKWKDIAKKLYGVCVDMLPKKIAETEKVDAELFTKRCKGISSKKRKIKRLEKKLQDLKSA